MKVPEEMACNTPFAMSRPLLLSPVSVISVPMATPESKDIEINLNVVGDKCFFGHFHKNANNLVFLQFGIFNLSNSTKMFPSDQNLCGPLG